MPAKHLKTSNTPHARMPRVTGTELSAYARVDCKESFIGLREIQVLKNLPVKNFLLNCGRLSEEFG